MSKRTIAHLHIALNLVACIGAIGYYLMTGALFASVPLTIVAIFMALTSIALLLSYQSEQLMRIALVGTNYIGTFACILAYGYAAPLSISLILLSVVTSFLLFGIQLGAWVTIIFALVASTLHSGLVEYAAIALTLLLIIVLLRHTHPSTEEITKEMQRQIDDERAALNQRLNIRAQEAHYDEIKQLQESNRLAEFGKISTGLFHDLMNPLSALANNVEQLGKSDLSQAQLAEFAQQSVEAAQRIKRVLTSAQELLHSGAGMSTFAVHDAIQEVAQLFAYTMRIATIELRIAVPPTLRISGPRNVFLQIMMNLISNSIEAFADQSDQKLITIRAHTSMSFVWIHVSDNGSGIPDEIKEKITKTPVTTKSTGVGIGLYQSRQLLESAFKGEMVIESDEGRGTIVSLKIPLQEP